MISSAFASLLARRQVHYGWVMAAVTFVVMLTTASALGAPGVLMPPLEKEFGWTTAEISSALALRLVLYGVIAPFAAALMIRVGLKRVVASALALILVGLALSTQMQARWQLTLTWGLLVGLGSGMTAMVLGATVASRWFTKRRGVVIGLLSASSATGQLAFLPVVARLSESHGWRTAILLIAGLLSVTLVLVVLFMRDRPEELLQRPYGEPVDAPQAPPPPRISPLGTLREVSASRTFWVLFATFFICGASTNGLVQTHFVSMCGDYGMMAVAAASVLALMGLFDFIGTVGSGWLSDRYDARWLLFWYYALRGLSLLYLPHAEFTVAGLSPFAVFYGLDWIATVPPTLKLTTDAFGREKAGVVFGWIFMGHQLGAASIAYGAGVIRTAQETYTPAFLLAGALCLVAAGLALSIRRKSAPVLVPATA
ncbi:MAG TPA: MFS transporter [Gemmatimonas aurantiaca]|uniref:Major facilitator superfamily protein n=2 Tax=Gemmatimonas aurantiaca TaxID=173480 RepID=C1ACT1_GEMAT|nr:MFS transporter [Gemmatimonas aurantiaca]BAH40308.1 major facilitator superfamily protein [Gemmatimonas aurantiaca T-27]HCT57682.1 MFS transporter [Gemmatimonas aurantiaca]